MKTRQCPHCSASMDIETSVCPECGNPILSQSKKRRLPTWFFILIILEIIGIGVLIFYFTYGRFAKKDAYLNAMAIGLERRFSETRNTDEMTDEEILEWYRSVVDGELAYIEDYADRSFSDSRFTQLAHNYINACRLQRFATQKECCIFDTPANFHFWDRGYYLRAYAVIELTKYGLSLTPEVLSSFQDSVNEAQYDKYANLLYSANYIPDAMLEVLNQAIQVDEYSPGFIFDAKSNTCSYSWIVSGTTSDKLDLVTDYTGITNNVSKVNGTLLPFFHAIHIAPDILCTLYTRDGERFLEYNNDTQTYKHPLMGTKSTHSSYTPRPSSGSSTTFHSKDRSMDAWVCAKMYVETNLKSPSTAKFCKYPDATIMRIGEDEYIVRGYVDAENSFGATVRQYWTVDLFLTEKGFRDPYLEFD